MVIPDIYVTNSDEELPIKQHHDDGENESDPGIHWNPYQVL